MKIKFYSIAKDAWEAGDFQTCQECNAQIRHVMEVEGQPYGLDCGRTVAGWSKRRAKRVSSKIELYSRSLKYFMDKGNFDRAYFDGAYPIIALLGLQREIPFTTCEEVSEIALELIS
jgi:hypothetical protein